MRRVPAEAKVYVDGQVLDGEQACVSVFDRGFLYGDGVYEVTRTVRGEPLFLAEHLDRLAASARAIELELPPHPRIAAAVGQTLQALGQPRAYLRIVVTRGAGEIGLDPACADAPLLVVIARPLQLPDQRLYRDGAAVVCVPLRRNAPGHLPPEVKSGNYLTSVLATAAARRRGAYEAVLCDQQGHIAEGASSNLFFVHGGRVRTPPLAAGLLPGITRRVVLELLRGHGVPCQEAPVTRQEAAEADEAFLTSSVRGVMPVVRLDDRPIGTGRPGPLTRALGVWYGEHIGEAPP
ncbi:MAG: aminotransferase class IV [Myxococcales bacterium]|nr:aminotransferase class IV [Myxococcales bacterium]